MPLVLNPTSLAPRQDKDAAKTREMLENITPEILTRFETGVRHVAFNQTGSMVAAVAE